jgi:hypothetical protein
MKALITLKDNTEHVCEVTHDKDKILFDFSQNTYAPLNILRKRIKKIEYQPADEEIGCCNDCDKCVTPIC